MRVLPDFTCTGTKPHLDVITAVRLDLRRTWRAAKTPFIARKLWTVGRALEEIQYSDGTTAAGRRWTVVALDALQAMDDWVQEF